VQTNFHTIVLGLGGIGAGAAYWLSRRLGNDVLGIEQFELFHVRGESQDHSRIIRHSYHTPTYVELTKGAYAAWQALEGELGRKLILKTGGLDLGPRVGAAINLQDYADSMAACGIAYEHLDANEIMRRYPQWQLSDDVHGLYQADGGIAPAALCNAAHIQMARAHGAVLVDGAPVSQIEHSSNEVRVTAGGATYTAQKLVIAAGPWSNTALAHLGLKLPLAISREQVLYFDSPHKDEFEPEKFPVWIWMDEPCFYGFPVFGEPAVKVAQDCGGYETTADGRTFEPDAANAKRVTDFTAKYLPRAIGKLHLLKTCLYTLTPDRDFVIDTLPDHPNISIAIGAGHAFKFASLLGKVLSELALDGKTNSDISPFTIDRKLLTIENPPVNYMV
jgi:sarcosine oxidase